MEKPICICVPCQDQVQTGFAFDLAALIGNWSHNHPDIPVHLVAIKGSLIPGQRQRIALNAIKANASHMFWLDTDMRFPPDTLDKLLAHDMDFVACNYTTRRGGCRPVTVGIYNDELIQTTENSTGLEAVAIVGFGVALMKTDMVKRLSMPLFNMEWSHKDQRFTGEDAFFCLKCWRELDVRPVIDHDLSKRIRHTGVLDYHHKHVDLSKIGEEGENF